MAEFTFIVVFAIFAFVLVTILALVLNPRLRARIGLPGHANFEIDTSRASVRSPPRVPKEKLASVRSSNVLRVWLAIKRRGKSDWVYSLYGNDRVYLGRGDNNHIRLANDLTVDERHAVIYVEKGRYYISNLSPRGIRVNNRLLVINQRQVLGDGNTIQIGATRLIFREKRK